MKRIEFIRNLKDAIFILLGVCMACIGLKCFLIPNGYIDGGAMGVSLLLKQLTNIELAIFVILVNLPFLIFGIKQISLQFTIKSILAISILAVLLHYVTLPSITEDKLLIAVFGGFFLGAGIGLTIRGGAVIDGTEVIAIYISRRTVFSVGDFIAIFNVTLFILAIVLIGIETAMYSMLIYFSASKTIDFIINGIEEYTAVLIVSEESERIKNFISNDLGKGVTVFNSEKGYGTKGHKEQRYILYCVVTRLEVTNLIFEIEKIDPHAFITQQSIKDLKGGLVRKRSLH
jgi:uncharacterized membrane-anchored protein YitT (DUF2179 family)